MSFLSVVFVLISPVSWDMQVKILVYHKFTLPFSALFLLPSNVHGSLPLEKNINLTLLPFLATILFLSFLSQPDFKGEWATLTVVSFSLFIKLLKLF